MEDDNNTASKLIEIKEILDNFKIYEDRYKKCNENQFIIFYRDIHLLLDYITNLQQENTLLKHNCKQAQNSCRQHRLASKNHIRRLQRREKQIEDYKSRIEKAVEKLKKIQQNAIKYGAEHDAVVCQELIDGLNGRSDE